MSSRAKLVGRFVAEEQDRELAELPPVPEPHWPDLRGRARWRMAGLAALVGVVVFTVAALFPLTATTSKGGVPRFQIGGRPGELGAWLEPKAGVSETVTFFDRSTMDLDPEAGARVIELNREQVKISLERGRAHFRVRPSSGLNWSIVAGPFEVRVTGTEFSLAWQAEAQRLRVHLRSGGISLRGCGQKEGRRLKPGEPMFFDCPSPAPSNSAASPLLHQEPESSSDRQAPAQPKAPLRDEQPWRALARDGHYHEAMVQLEASGFSDRCMTADHETLSTIATVARLSGRTERAVEAYTLMRQRFPGSSGAVLAAFALGRLEFEQRSNLAAAAKWFEAYLEEAPNGRLAPEAQGRLIEAYHRMGSAAAARKAARRYVARYPQGSHRDIAQELVGTEAESH